MALKKNQTLPKTESIQIKVIGAIGTASKVIEAVEKAKQIFDEIKAEVEVAKSEMDLGLKQYEAEIEEKKAALNEEYSSLEKGRQEALEALDEQIKIKQASNNREMEELKYSHVKAIERESLVTADVIAEKFDKVLVEKSYIEDLKVERESEIAKLTEIHENELKEKSKGYAIAENKIKSEMGKENALLQVQLDASEKANTKLESEVTYLKSQLEATRSEITKAVAAAKAEVNVNNDNTARK